MRLYAIMAAKGKQRRYSISDNDGIYFELYHKNNRVGYIAYTGEKVIVNDTEIDLGTQHSA